MNEEQTHRSQNDITLGDDQQNEMYILVLKNQIQNQKQKLQEMQSFQQRHILQINDSFQKEIEGLKKLNDQIKRENDLKIEEMNFKFSLKETHLININKIQFEEKKLLQNMIQQINYQQESEINKVKDQMSQESLYQIEEHEKNVVKQFQEYMDKETKKLKQSYLISNEKELQKQIEDLKALNTIYCKQIEQLKQQTQKYKKQIENQQKQFNEYSEQYKNNEITYKNKIMDLEQKSQIETDQYKEKDQENQQIIEKLCKKYESTSDTLKIINEKVTKNQGIQPIISTNLTILTQQFIIYQKKLKEMLIFLSDNLMNTLQYYKSQKSQDIEMLEQIFSKMSQFVTEKIKEQKQQNKVEQEKQEEYIYGNDILKFVGTVNKIYQLHILGQSKVEGEIKSKENELLKENELKIKLENEIQKENEIKIKLENEIQNENELIKKLENEIQKQSELIKKLENQSNDLIEEQFKILCLFGKNVQEIKNLDKQQVIQLIKNEIELLQQRKNQFQAQVQDNQKLMESKLNLKGSLTEQIIQLLNNYKQLKIQKKQIQQNKEEEQKVVELSKEINNYKREIHKLKLQLAQLQVYVEKVEAQKDIKSDILYSKYEHATEKIQQNTQKTKQIQNKMEDIIEMKLDMMENLKNEIKELQKTNQKTEKQKNKVLLLNNQLQQEIQNLQKKFLTQKIAPFSDQMLEKNLNLNLDRKQSLKMNQEYFKKLTNLIQQNSQQVEQIDNFKNVDEIDEENSNNSFKNDDQEEQLSQNLNQIQNFTEIENQGSEQLLQLSMDKSSDISNRKDQIYGKQTQKKSDDINSSK